MATQNVKILLKRGTREEITSTLLEVGEMGFTTDTNQLFVGIEDAINEVQFDSFANAHGVIQSWLDSVSNPEPGLIVDEDLVIRNVNDVDALLEAMGNTAGFYVYLYGRARKNVEVVTENSFNSLFADQHLSIFDAVEGRRSSLFKKTFTDTSDTFLSYDKNICSTFFIDYSLVQSTINNATRFVRAGTIKVINGVPHGINQVKLTDENTEIWQDDSDNIAETDEFSNVEFSASIVGDDMVITITQQAMWYTEVTYTIKRWSMA